MNNLVSKEASNSDKVSITQKKSIPAAVTGFYLYV